MVGVAVGFGARVGVGTGVPVGMGVATGNAVGTGVGTGVTVGISAGTDVTVGTGVGAGGTVGARVGAASVRGDEVSAGADGLHAADGMITTQNNTNNFRRIVRPSFIPSGRIAAVSLKSPRMFVNELLSALIHFQ